VTAACAGQVLGGLITGVILTAIVATFAAIANRTK